MASSSDHDPDQLRPRIGGKRGQINPERVPTFRRSVLARMQQRFVGSPGGTGSPAKSHGGRTAVGADVREPPPYSRRCLIKARVVPMNGRGVAAARLHLRYIERDGVERDGTKGELYGAGESVDRDVLRTEVRAEKHQFRFIVSPEDAGAMDLKVFTRALIDQVERDLGRRLIWAAVNHHDTDNPHVHIVVRGLDVRGREVRIDREYISRRMRWRAQEIATRELGPRAPAELDRQRDREVGQERLTELDREIERLSAGGAIDMADLVKLSHPRQRARLLGRVHFLERLAIARRLAPGSWVLEEGWREALKELGERGDIIKRIHAALPRPGDSARYQVIDSRTEREPVEGVLRRKGLHDELRGDMFAVVEDAAGRAHYVRTDAATLAQVEEGAIVRVSASRDTWAKGMDAAIVKVASEAGRVYDPGAHLATLRRQPVVIGGQRVDPQAVIDANVRRLERLARYGLVTPLPGGRWTVPADLVEQLKAREKTHPRLRVRVERIAPSLSAQVSHGGPAWMDAAPVGAPFGFAAEVQAARHGRGARRPPPERVRPGGEVTMSPPADMRALGERLARDRGLRFVAEPPAGHRGVIVDVGDGVGDRFAAIVDERARTIALVPRVLVPKEAIGRAVEITRTADGTLAVRRRDLTKDA